MNMLFPDNGGIFMCSVFIKNKTLKVRKGI